MDGFQEAVQHPWTAAGQTGCPLERLSAKFQATARALQSWSAKRIGNVTEQLEMARDLLHRLDIAQDGRPLNLQEAWLRKQLKQRSLALASLQRTIARVRSRLDRSKKVTPVRSIFSPMRDTGKEKISYLSW